MTCGHQVRWGGGSSLQSRLSVHHPGRKVAVSSQLHSRVCNQMCINCTVVSQARPHKSVNTQLVPHAAFTIHSRFKPDRVHCPRKHRTPSGSKQARAQSCTHRAVARCYPAAAPSCQLQLLLGGECDSRIRSGPSPPHLQVRPPMERGTPPAAGKRVRAVAPGFEHTQVGRSLLCATALSLSLSPSLSPSLSLSLSLSLLRFSLRSVECRTGMKECAATAK